MEEAHALISDVLGDFASGEHGSEIVTRMAELVTGRVAAAADEADVEHNRRLVAGKRAARADPMDGLTSVTKIAQ